MGKLINDLNNMRIVERIKYNSFEFHNILGFLWNKFK